MDHLPNVNLNISPSVLALLVMTDRIAYDGLATANPQLAIARHSSHNVFSPYDETVNSQEDAGPP
jgi:hypothetical protein